MIDVAAIRDSLSDPARVVRLLGIGKGSKRSGGGLLIRCPVHEDSTPSCSLTKGPDGTLRCRCHACEWTGDVFHLVAAVHRLDAKRDFRRVAEIAAELAGRRDLLDAGPSIERPKRAPEPERTYPPQAEVLDLWSACRPVTEAPEVYRYLEARGLLPLALELYDLARALPLEAELPGWATYQRERWTTLGYRLLLPMFDAHGVMRSVRACRVTEGDTPKRLPPAGHRAGELVMADALGQEILRTGQRPSSWPDDEQLKVIICEGEPDFWSWATRYISVPLPSIPTIGILSGAWTEQIAARIPDGALVLIRTDHDQAGAKYAEHIYSTLGARCRVLRERAAA